MIRQGLTTRKDGNMVVAIGETMFPEGEKNRAKAMALLSIKQLVVCKLAHGTTVRRITANDGGNILWNVDALVTTEPDVFCAVTVADCLPVYFSDAEHGVIGIAHAGWRGIVSGIISATLKELEACGADIGRTNVEIGPGIHDDHFEVQADVLPRFALYPNHIKNRESKHFVDLYGIVFDQLLFGGVAKEKIIASDECTACLPDKFFSYRRNKPEIVEAMLAYIGRTSA